MANIPNSRKPRLGFLGGTFDPPHNGHLEIARLAIENEKLDKLLFCPAHHAPLRQETTLFSAEHRLAMVSAICQQYPQMEVYDGEVNHGKTRYSYETIDEVKSLYPEYELFFILGMDQFYRLNEWKNAETLARWVHFLIFARQNKSSEVPAIPNLRFSFMDNDLINISSTDIRRQLHSNQTLPLSLLPPEVSRYIHTHNLFSPPIIPSA